MVPFTPPPSWLDVSAEIVESDQPKEYKNLSDNQKALVFILLSLRSLFRAIPTLTKEQAMSVVSNSIAETGWGKSWKGFNFGGWKISKSDCDKYKAEHHRSAPWWRAAGHVASGDQAVAYYRAFRNPDEYYMEWLERFVPRGATTKHRYYETGRKFWSNRAWFRDLCLAGYKGVVTAANPDKSVQAHDQIVRRAKTLFVQHMLGVSVDGAWGKNTTRAWNAFQTRYGLALSDDLNEATFSTMVDVWKARGMVLTVSCFDQI